MLVIPALEANLGHIPRACLKKEGRKSLGPFL
jgi:hypothetical protein